MVMRVMLIGLLVIGVVAMLETDVSACRMCGNPPCCYLQAGDDKELKELLEEVEKHEDSQVWIIGDTDDDRLSRKRADVRDMLIRHGLQPEIIGELIYKDPALLRSMRKEQVVMGEGQVVIVTRRKLLRPGIGP